MKICGIDASTKKTGIALLENGKLIEYRLIDYSREQDLDKRMREMCMSIDELLNYFEPDLILCEDVWISKNPNTAKTLARLGGAIYMWSILNNTYFKFVIPSAWRVAVGLNIGRKKRETLKQLSIDKVKEEYGIEPGEDVCVAILIGLSGVIDDSELFDD